MKSVQNQEYAKYVPEIMTAIINVDDLSQYSVRLHTVTITSAD